jgi:hypothetical protein
MDLLCVGMYRSASTWQYHVAGHLLERHRRGERLGYMHVSAYPALPAPSRDRWRFLKLHDPHEICSARLRAGEALALYSYRDIRDVYLSLVHKLGSDPAHAALVKPTTEQCLANDRFWRAQPNVLCQRYEELIAHPDAAVAQIAGYLGIALTAGDIAATAAEFSIEANKRRIDVFARNLRETGCDLDDPQYVSRSDPHTLLHLNHIRSGTVGGWRTETTAEERAWLSEVCGDWLIANGYERDCQCPARPEDRPRYDEPPSIPF